MGSVASVHVSGLTPGPWGHNFQKWDPVAYMRITALTLISDGRLSSPAAKQQNGHLLPYPSELPAFF